MDTLREWPKPIREDFGISLAEMQEGRPALLPVRPMPSIAAGVFELKDSDEKKWYRLVYLARVKDTVYVLHCFTKNTTKTERRDLATAEQRWKQVQQRLRGAKNMKSKGSRQTGSAHLSKGSVLDDLGFSPSEALEIKVKAEIYRDLLQYIRQQGLSQQQLGTVLGIHQPDVSNLLNGRVSKFSVSKLIKLAGKLNLGAKIKLIQPKAGKLPSLGASVQDRRAVRAPA